MTTAAKAPIMKKNKECVKIPIVRKKTFLNIRSTITAVHVNVYFTVKKA